MTQKFVVIIFAILLSTPTLAESSGGEYLIKLKSRDSISKLSRVENSDEWVEYIPQIQLLVSKVDPEKLIDFNLWKDEVEYVQINKSRNFLNSVTNNANDVISHNASSTQMSSNKYNGLWGWKTIRADVAWGATKGSGVLVAISDTGIYFGHGLLKTQVWSNPGETGVDANGKDKSKNGIDDDGNGFVDDVNGWDFASNKKAVTDNHYHGTHVAGTIAARDGNGPVTGVAPEAKIVASTFITSSGSGTDLNGAKSLIYAVDIGAKIINCSWGGHGTSPVIKDALDYAESKGVLVVAAAGNSDENTDSIFNTPSSYDNSNIIAVGATYNKNHERAYFSNYGAETVDLAAPGYNIMSTSNPAHNPRKYYLELSGTSMAAPHVSGTAALVWSLHPSWTYEEVKAQILESAEWSKFWQGISVTEAALRADQAVGL